GASLTVRQPALLKASLRVNRRLLTSSAYRWMLLTHSPDCRVECTSQLIPPKLGEVSQALRADHPARASEAARWRRNASTPGERLVPWTATSPQASAEAKHAPLPRNPLGRPQARPPPRGR